MMCCWIILIEFDILVLCAKHSLAGAPFLYVMECYGGILDGNLKPI